ncbi:MAG: PAS domain S-box protein [Acidobacteriota bacterium]
MADATRVLIVEDLQTDAELAEREVRAVLAGATFLRVETEEAFLAALESFRPDVVLSDFKLPNFDGLTALRLAQEHAPAIPFIIITGSMDEDTAVACMKAGAWDYVIKEHIKRLGPAIMAALDRERLVRERGAAQQSLRESEALFRSVFEDHVAVKLIIDPDTGQIVDANKAAADFYGWPREQLRRMRIHEINTLPPEDLRAAMETARLGHGAFFQFRHRRADHSVREVEVFSSTVKTWGRDLLHSIVHDVTERKRAEEERERLLAAIEQAGETILITDAAGTVQYVNPAFVATSGYARDEAIGRTPRILKSGQHDPSFYQNLWETISSGRTWEGRIINKRKDGTLYTEDATISPVSDKAGRIINYVAVKRDITEHLDLAAQFQQAQKMEAVGRLAGGVAHDYNNMLSVILGYTELLLDKAEPSSPLHDDLLEILNAARRSADITRQLLAFARKQAIEPVVLDLNDAVERMLKILDRLIGEDIDLVLRPAAALPPVLIDPAQVDQIMANLCVNARDAIAGVGKITIETDCLTIDETYAAHHPGSVPGEFVVLSVSDNGRGMDKETVSHLFEPFFTTKPAGKGTGLGLSTVYGIVKQNGGFINVYSEPDVGTTFRIYLPRHAGDADAVEPEGGAQAWASRGETVLLVEDEEPILRLGQTILARLGYTLLSASTPQEAIRLAHAHTGDIHLLITDVIMPGMNGRDLAERVRALRPGVKVLFMSGYTADVIARHGVLDPGVSYLQKPFRLRDMAAKVRASLDRNH